MEVTMSDAKSIHRYVELYGDHHSHKYSMELIGSTIGIMLV